MYCNIAKKITGLSCMIVILVGCMHPPYNNFKPDHRTARNTATKATVGSSVGLIASSTLSGTLIGGAAGGVIGLAQSTYKDSKAGLVKQLNRESIQFVEYDNRNTLIVPTDEYYHFMSPRLNEIAHPGLNDIVRLINLYPKSTIYVAAFTDDVGTNRHKRKLTQAQAETMMTFLWAHDIHRARLLPMGYADKFDIGDNHLIHGSAYNRRVEIQWNNGPEAACNAMQPMQTK